MTLLHGTGIFFENKGLLFTGKSGVGKSDLALRMMARGAELVSDDYVTITIPSTTSDSSTGKGCPVMQAPATIAGLIEVRHVGLLTVDYRAQAPLDLILNLVNDSALLDRLPDRKTRTVAGQDIPCLDFYALTPTAPEKIQAALRCYLDQQTS